MSTIQEMINKLDGDIRHNRENNYMIILQIITIVRAQQQHADELERKLNALQLNIQGLCARELS